MPQRKPAIPTGRDPASVAKAARLNEQIARLTSGPPAKPAAQPASPSGTGESPRAFIQRRMAELAGGPPRAGKTSQPKPTGGSGKKGAKGKKPA